MVHYYDKVQKSTIDLNNWIQRDNESRPPWSSFCLKMITTYGFDSDRMLKTLKKMYPDLSIEDDKLVRYD